MPTGLILTMGLSPEPLVFSIQELKADFVVFIGTEKSLNDSVDETVLKANLKPSQYNKLEIKDSPEEIGALCQQFQHAKDWLEGKGCEKVLSDPTGGRKWMSAGAVMVASFLGIPMMYVDARYENREVVLDSMKTVELGNAYDQTGFIIASKGRDAFNAFDFSGAAYHFGQISPTHAHKKELFQGLSLLCSQLARWDRFEHYSAPVSEDILNALQQVERALRSGAGSPELAAFSDQMKAFAGHLKSMEGTNTLSVDFITDIYLNAGRCIQRNRFDDAVARHYRTLEAISQYFLREAGIEANSPDYSVLDENKMKLFLSATRDNVAPSKIDLKLGFWLLRVLEHSITRAVFKDPKKPTYKSFGFEGILNERNESILAHGFRPIGSEKANSFHGKIEELLHSAFEEIFLSSKQNLTLPSLPTLGF